MFRSLILAAALGAPWAALAEPVETEIPGVSADVAELRTDGGVTRLAIRYKNDSAKEAGTKRFEAGTVVLVDVKSKQKHLPMKDANGQFVAGPLGDAIGGGRIYVKMQPGQEAVAWIYFDPIPAGTVVNVEVPQMFPFEDVAVSEGPGTLLSASTGKSTPHGALASLVSAKRADQALKARLKLAAEPGTKVSLRSPYFEYKDVYLFDPQGKRRYPLLKDAEGIFQASPIGQKMGGGTFLPNWSTTILMSLTFQAPPDDVTSVDLILPDFLPIQGVAIEGLGGAAAGGIAAAGKTLGLEGALKELQAEVTPQEIKIDLSADVLFDFDKSDLKPAAEEQLGNLLTVVNSRPGATVAIEGHTDVRGDAAYNQALSVRRAESVRTWLAAHGVSASRLTATGAGESRPVRSGNTEADHQANRRVEIRIRGGAGAAASPGPAVTASPPAGAVGVNGTPAVEFEPGSWRLHVASTTNGKADPVEDTEECLRAEDMKGLGTYFMPALEGAEADCRSLREPSDEPRRLDYTMHCSGHGFTVDATASVRIAGPQEFSATMRMDSRSERESAVVLAEIGGSRKGPCP